MAAPWPTVMEDGKVIENPEYRKYVETQQSQEPPLTHAQHEYLDALDNAIKGPALSPYFGGATQLHQALGGDAGAAAQAAAEHLCRVFDATVKANPNAHMLDVAAATVKAAEGKLYDHHLPGDDRAETPAARRDPRAHEIALEQDRQESKDPWDFDSNVRDLEVAESFRNAYARAHKSGLTPDQHDEQTEVAWQRQGQKCGMPAADGPTDAGSSGLDQENSNDAAILATFDSAYDREGGGHSQRHIESDKKYDESSKQMNQAERDRCVRNLTG